MCGSETNSNKFWNFQTKIASAGQGIRLLFEILSIFQSLLRFSNPLLMTEIVIQPNPSDGEVSLLLQLVLALERE
jgi:hypothetical protein